MDSNTWQGHLCNLTSHDRSALTLIEQYTKAEHCLFSSHCKIHCKALKRVKRMAAISAAVVRCSSILTQAKGKLGAIWLHFTKCSTNKLPLPGQFKYKSEVVRALQTLHRVLVESRENVCLIRFIWQYVNAERRSLYYWQGWAQLLYVQVVR